MGDSDKSRTKATARLWRAVRGLTVLAVGAAAVLAMVGMVATEDDDRHGY